MDANSRIENVETLTIMARKLASKYGTVGFLDADDIAQNALIRVLKKHGRDRLPTGRWLVWAVRFAALDVRRANHREEKFLLRGYLDSTPEAGDTGFYAPPRIESFASKVHEPAGCEQCDELTECYAAIDRLHRMARTTLYLAVEGYTYEEIAKKTGVSVGTVRSRLHYARQRVRQMLKRS